MIDPHSGKPKSCLNSSSAWHCYGMGRQRLEGHQFTNYNLRFTGICIVITKEIETVWKSNSGVARIFLRHSNGSAPLKCHPWGVPLLLPWLLCTEKCHERVVLGGALLGIYSEKLVVTVTPTKMVMYIMGWVTNAWICRIKDFGIPC